MPSQNQIILAHLRDKGSITSRYAALHLGVWRCSARIRDLKDKGVIIKPKEHENPDHPGPIGNWVEYIYKGEYKDR